MLVSSFNLSQTFNYTPYFFYKKLFKSEINSFCIWTQRAKATVIILLRTCSLGGSLLCIAKHRGLNPIGQMQCLANLDQAPKDLDKTIFRDLSPTPKP